MGDETHTKTVGLVTPMSLGTLALLIIISTVFYRLYLHPLRYIPGPALAKTSSLYLYVICYFGIEGRIMRYYHHKYKTKVLRISPNSVSISDDAAIHDMYIAGGGFLKDKRYQNLNMGPVETIFSTLNTNYRDLRAKAVAPLFSPSRLRRASEPGGIIYECTSEFVHQLEVLKDECRSQNKKLDILDLCARLSLDVVSGYLLNRRYGGLVELQNVPTHSRLNTKLSINPFIFAIVGFSRFSLLPNWLFCIMHRTFCRFVLGSIVAECGAKMNTFARNIVAHAVAADAKQREDSYQARLLATGISPEEVQVQCQAIIFAGSDSTAVKLATILFHLVQNPNSLRRLYQELTDGDKRGKSVDHLPYLRAVVKEGLRLGMANPTRLTRVVPPNGLRVGNYFIPSGTVAGTAAYVLHHNPDVFPDPFTFRPERWLDGDEDIGLRRPNMERNLIMFGAGLRACIGKNLAQQQLFEAVIAVTLSRVFEGARTCKDRIELVEWFNAEIKDHVLEIEWSS